MNRALKSAIDSPDRIVFRGIGAVYADQKVVKPAFLQSRCDCRRHLETGREYVDDRTVAIDVFDQLEEVASACCIFQPLFGNVRRDRSETLLDPSRFSHLTRTKNYCV